MKKILTTIMLLAVCAQIFAEEPKFVNGDGSTITDLCIASITSTKSIKGLIREFGLNPMIEEQVACNGLSIDKFSRKYQTSSEILETTIVSFHKGDSEPGTELCFAAVTGSENYESLKDSFFSRTHERVSSVLCNDLPLDKFIRKYGQKAFTASL